MTGGGLTLWLGPGYVLHLSTENGFQFERAEHGTWRVGILFAVRRSGVTRCATCQMEPADAEGVSAEIQAPAVPPYMTLNEARAERWLPPLEDAVVSSRRRRWFSPSNYLADDADQRIDLSALPADRQEAQLREFIRFKPRYSGRVSLRANLPAWLAVGDLGDSNRLFIRNMVAEVSDQ